MSGSETHVTRAVFDELAHAGLRVSGVRGTAELDEASREALVEANHDIERNNSLVFFGQAGTRLWDRHVSHQLERDHPFDEVATDLVRTAFARHVPTATIDVVYPGPAMLPLGSLATSIGWGFPSPLGLVIHPEWGLWTAHRVVLLTSLELEPSAPLDPGLHACAECADRPCIDACPVDAVSVDTGFDVRACAEHRAPPGSSCEFTCHARWACPVGAEHRYGPEQARHHYASGLASIRSWLADSPD